VVSAPRTRSEQDAQPACSTTNSTSTSRSLWTTHGRDRERRAGFPPLLRSPRRLPRCIGWG
jgi:hypothetical protein